MSLKKGLFSLAAGLVLMGSSANISLASSCNYTVKDIKGQLPFVIRDAKIVEQTKLTKNICSIILKTQSYRGRTRFMPIFAVDGEGMIVGSLFKDRHSITGKKITKLQIEEGKKKFTSVKKDLNKIVIAKYKPKKANGKVLYAFVDPTCPFCHLAEKQFKDLADKSKYTIAIVPFIVHGKHSEDMDVSFICAKKSFDDYVNGDFGKHKPCKKSDKILKLAKDVTSKLGLSGTPTFFTSDGEMIVGANMNKLKKTLGVE